MLCEWIKEKDIKACADSYKFILTTLKIPLLSQEEIVNTLSTSIYQQLNNWIFLSPRKEKLFISYSLNFIKEILLTIL